MENSEVDIVLVEYVIHLETNPQTWPFVARCDTRIENGTQQIYEMLNSQHIPLTSPPHGLFYDPESPENLAIKSKRNPERINSARGSARINASQLQALRATPDESAAPRKSTASVNPKHKSSASAWRELASNLTHQQVQIQTEMPGEVSFVPPCSTGGTCDSSLSVHDLSRDLWKGQSVFLNSLNI